MPQTLFNDLKNLIDLVGNVTEAYTSALFLVDENNPGQLNLEVYHSLSNNIIPEASITYKQGLIGWVAKNERATHATNFDRDTTTLKFYSKDEKIKSFAAAPLFVGGRLVGVLSVDSKKQYLFTAKEIKILDDFAEAAGSVIAQGSRRIKLDEEAVAFEALSDIVTKITVCEKFDELSQMLRLNLPSLIPHEHLAVAIRSHEEDMFRMIPAASGEAGDSDKVGSALPLTHYRLGWVIGQGRLIHLAGLQGVSVFPGDGKKWRSFIGAPIMAGDSVTGAIGLLSRKPKQFRQIDLQSLSILAASLSSVFTSLRLHRKSIEAGELDNVTKTISRQTLRDAFVTIDGEGVVMMLNLHGFTKINTQLGWEGGDYVLKETMERLSEAIGDGGEVCRDYADRFILLIHDIGIEEISPLVQSIITAVETEPFVFGGYEIHLSCSIGVTRFPKDGASVEQLAEKARIAVMHAKNATGSRVWLYEESGASLQGQLRSVKRA
ncbi:diguanylate cyclase/phosphodiesterase (GGDEF & EAL domains) with PAS/PAC sensor(s) [hydrothermal vent metagenome]|uniref:Diguanylate cyclase/phosphodiesterase (GGDEF & EAL domains) with PAS/PAC sensor(S) n=1 Tax=hydrothermal vent metagenome TaxID=652676 RepID=A0A3B1C415_9ZZZZ